MIEKINFLVLLLAVLNNLTCIFYLLNNLAIVDHLKGLFL